MKTYTINGKKIKMDEASPRDVLEQLLDALDEKKEECKGCEWKYVSGNESTRHTCVKKEPYPKYNSHYKDVSSKEETKSECKHEWSRYDSINNRICHKCDLIEPKSTLREIEVDKEAFDNIPNYKIHLPDCACSNHTKSTLKEEISYKMYSKYATESFDSIAEEIISLFKDTLLKEIRENRFENIDEIIKNL